MSLTISTEPMDNRQLALKVEVPQERVEQELRKAARKAAGKYRIPGFRQGKAPYSIVLQYVGLPALFEEFVEDLGQEVYRTALEQEKIEPYAMASLDITSMEPLTYTFSVPLEPAVNLGDYRSLRIEEEEPIINEAQVDEELETYRAQFSAWTDVDRPSAYGDTLTLDVKSVIAPDASNENTDENAEETIVLDETDWDVTLDEENPMDPPGFDAALLDLSAGDEKEVTLSWPADSQSVYAGKEALFHIKVHKIEALEKPALDDEFAQLVGPDFNTLEDLQKHIRTRLLNDMIEETEENYLEKALDALVAQSEMDYPPIVVEDQIDAMINEFQRQLSQYGIENLDDYLRQMGLSREEYRENLREQAEITARRNLVISELYQLEEIEATDADVEERIETLFGSMGEENAEAARSVRDMMLAGSGRAVLESQILQQKALDRLLAIVRGDELPALGQKAPAEAADETVEAAEAVEPAAANVEAQDDEAQDDEAQDDEAQA